MMIFKNDVKSPYLHHDSFSSLEKFSSTTSKFLCYFCKRPRTSRAFWTFCSPSFPFFSILNLQIEADTQNLFVGCKVFLHVVKWNPSVHQSRRLSGVLLEPFLIKVTIDALLKDQSPRWARVQVCAFYAPFISNSKHQSHPWDLNIKNNFFCAKYIEFVSPDLKIEKSFFKERLVCLVGLWKC